jgi:hypothetical protein
VVSAILKYRKVSQKTYEKKEEKIYKKCNMFMETINELLFCPTLKILAKYPKWRCLLFFVAYCILVLLYHGIAYARWQIKDFSKMFICNNFPILKKLVHILGHPIINHLTVHDKTVSSRKNCAQNVHDETVSSWKNCPQNNHDERVSSWFYKWVADIS